jgi:hypothetical protein
VALIDSFFSNPSIIKKNSMLSKHRFKTKSNDLSDEHLDKLNEKEHQFAVHNDIFYDIAQIIAYYKLEHDIAGVDEQSYEILVNIIYHPDCDAHNTALQNIQTIIDDYEQIRRKSSF